MVNIISNKQSDHSADHFFLILQIYKPLGCAVNAIGCQSANPSWENETLQDAQIQHWHPLTADLWRESNTASQTRKPESLKFLWIEGRCFRRLFMPGKYRLRQLWQRLVWLNGAWSIIFWQLKSEVWKYLPSWRLQWVWFSQTLLMQLLRQNKTARCGLLKVRQRKVWQTWSSETQRSPDTKYICTYTLYT